LREVFDLYWLTTCERLNFCGVPGNTILDAAATVRDAIAQSEMTHTPLRVLSLDFREAFDRVSQQYLFTILKAYGLQESFVDRIKHMYQDATSTVKSTDASQSQSPCGAPSDKVAH
jgi:hypothetical protein